MVNAAAQVPRGAKRAPAGPAPAPRPAEREKLARPGKGGKPPCLFRGGVEPGGVFPPGGHLPPGGRGGGGGKVFVDFVGGDVRTSEGGTTDL